MDVVTGLPADAQAAKPVQVGERTFRKPALSAQSAAVLDARRAMTGFHAEVPDEPTVPVVVVAAVARHEPAPDTGRPVGPLKRSETAPAD